MRLIVRSQYSIMSFGGKTYIIVLDTLATSGQTTPAVLSRSQLWRPIVCRSTHWDSSEWVLLQMTLSNSIGPFPAPKLLTGTPRGIYKPTAEWSNCISVFTYYPNLDVDTQAEHRQHLHPFHPSHSHTLSPILRCSKTPLVLLSHSPLHTAGPHHLYMCLFLLWTWMLMNATKGDHDE